MTRLTETGKQTSIPPRARVSGVSRQAIGVAVAVGFTAKGKARSAVALAHSKLRDQAASRAAKEYWTARLDALTSLLAGASE